MGLKDVVDAVAGIIKNITTADTEETQSDSNNGGGNANGSGTIRIQYYKSYIGAPQNQRQVVRCLGLTKLNQTVERSDTPSMRGAVAKVPHLLRIVE